MLSRPYSTCVYQAALPLAVVVQTLYTVPADRVFVLHDVGAVSFGAAGSSIYLMSDAILGGLVWAVLTVPVSGTGLQWAGRQAFGPGTSLQARNNQGGLWHLRASGFLLTT